MVRAEDLATGARKRQVEITPSPETMSLFDEERFTALEKNSDKQSWKKRRKGL